MKEHYQKIFDVRILKNYIVDDETEHIEINHQFAIQDEADNYFDFLGFCFDIVKGVFKKNLKMYNMPEFYKAIDDGDVDLEHIDLVLSKYMAEFTKMNMEQKIPLEDLKKDKE